jgi:ABC-2 type transport system permease protein
MNRRIRVIMRNEFQATLGRRGFVVTTALLPALALIALVVLAIVQGVQTEPTDETDAVGYVDHSGLLEGGYTLDGTSFVSFDDRATAIQALRDGDVERLVEIPSNYVASGVIIEIQEERGGIPGFGQETHPEIQRLLVDQLLAGTVTPEVAERVRSPATEVTVLSVDEAGNPVQDPFDGGRVLFFLVAGGLVLFATMMTSGYFQEGLSEEKENRIMEVLLSSSSPRDLMVGKFLALGGLGLTQLGIWVVSLGGLLALVPTSVHVLAAPEHRAEHRNGSTNRHPFLHGPSGVR